MASSRASGRLIGPIFMEMGRAVGELYASYGESERQVLLDFQKRMTALLHDETRRLGGGRTGPER